MPRLLWDLGMRARWAMLVALLIVAGAVAFDLGGGLAEAARGYVCGDAACTIFRPISGVTLR